MRLGFTGGNDMANAIQFKVNGVAHSFDGDPDTPLLWYLRGTLGLTGTKFNSPYFREAVAQMRTFRFIAGITTAVFNGVASVVLILGGHSAVLAVLTIPLSCIGVWAAWQASSKKKDY